MGRPTKWTDEELIAAITTSTTWSRVMALLDIKGGGTGRVSVVRRCLELGLDISHLPEVKSVEPKKKKRLDRVTVGDVDEETARKVWNESHSIVEVIDRLGLPRDSGTSYRAYHRLKDRYDLDSSHFGGQRDPAPIPRVNDQFCRDPDDAHLPMAAPSMATAWFLHRGYKVSVPSEPALYDLVVEDGDGRLHKVQVKSATTKADSGAYFARIAHQTWSDLTADLGSRGHTAYKRGEVDLFFIVCSDGSMFLVPLDVVEGKKGIVLGKKYREFRVQSSPSDGMVDMLGREPNGA